LLQNKNFQKVIHISFRSKNPDFFPKSRIRIKAKLILTLLAGLLLSFNAFLTCGWPLDNYTEAVFSTGFFEPILGWVCWWMNGRDFEKQDNKTGGRE
jgi:hypothetical protein